jgi:hypothetical protein
MYCGISKTVVLFEPRIQHILRDFEHSSCPRTAEIAYPVGFRKQYFSWNRGKFVSCGISKSVVQFEPRNQHVLPDFDHSSLLVSAESTYRSNIVVDPVEPILRNLATMYLIFANDSYSMWHYS